jgi:exonuclease SbcC
MRLLRLQLQDFRCFEAADLDLNVDGLIAVVGRNGAGKSTIFSAVEWALFGARRGAAALPVTRQGAEGPCWVELEFEVGGRTYAVRRVAGQDASLVDVSSGVTLASTLTETSRQAAVVLGLTQEMFGGTFYARQREVQALSDSARASDRREQLERLLGIEHLRRAAEIAGRDAKEQKVVVDTLAAESLDVKELKEEVERIEREAQEAAPAVQRAKVRVGELQAERERAHERLDALVALAEEAGRRRLAAQEAATDLGREQAILDAIRTQLAEARAASEQIERLAPVAARLEELAAREREMDLRREHHDRVVKLREQQRAALAQAALAADELAALPEDDAAALATQVQSAQEELERLANDLRAVAAERSAADAETGRLREALGRARRRAAIEAEIEQLGDADTQAGRAEERWHELRAQGTELVAAIVRETEHRDEIEEHGAEAVCLACRRPYGDEWEEILAAFDRDLAASRDRLGQLDATLADLAKQREALDRKAERLRELRAESSALETAPGVGSLEAALAAADAAAAEAAKREEGLESRYGELQTSLPPLRECAARAAEVQALRDGLLRRHEEAEREAAFYAEQASQLDVDGYDPDDHTRLRTELAEAQQAARRSSELKSAADSVELLERRATEQDAAVSEIASRHDVLTAAAEEIVVDAEQQDEARRERDRLVAELDEAERNLRGAERQASLDSEAVAAARERLASARKTQRRLQKERREERWRREVAAALSAYREDASRRARPTLEQETSLLLGEVTQTRYSIARLNDSYQLQIADGPELHPLRRFSGGEQDLASLCLRLALSRVLARQRGVESGFIILDEVFGSQDVERRRLLLAQLGELVEREFRQVFVVSHTDDVVQHCSLHIDVRRERGVSVAAGPYA